MLAGSWHVVRAGILFWVLNLVLRRNSQTFENSFQHSCHSLIIGIFQGIWLYLPVYTKCTCLQVHFSSRDNHEPVLWSQGWLQMTTIILLRCLRQVLAYSSLLIFLHSTRDYICFEVFSDRMCHRRPTSSTSCKMQSSWEDSMSLVSTWIIPQGIIIIIINSTGVV